MFSFIGEENLEQACKVFGFTSVWYRRQAKDGIFPEVVKGKINFPAAVTAVVAYYRKLAEGDGSLSLTDEKIRLTKVNADRKTLQLEKEQGRLIDAEAAIKVWSQIVVTFKARLQALPRKAAPVLFGSPSPAEIQAILEQEVYAVCNELSEPDLKSLASAAGIIAGKRAARPRKSPVKAKAKRKSVGGRKSAAKPGGGSGTRKVVHGKG